MGHLVVADMAARDNDDVELLPAGSRLPECVSELRQVLWPTRRSAQRSVRAALGAVVVIATFVAGLDVALHHGFVSLVR
jgi:preprotein translocase SecE subunit